MIWGICNTFLFNQSSLSHLRPTAAAPDVTMSLFLFTPLYWFSLKLKFEIRILPITFKVLQALTPLFMHNLVCIYVPSCNLLSASLLSLLLITFQDDRVKIRCFHTAGFSMVELSSSWNLQIWEINSLPLSLQDFNGLSHRAQSMVRPCDMAFIPTRPPPPSIFYS